MLATIHRYVQPFKVIWGSESALDFNAPLHQIATSSYRDLHNSGLKQAKKLSGQYVSIFAWRFFGCNSMRSGPLHASCHISGRELSVATYETLSSPESSETASRSKSTRRGRLYCPRLAKVAFRPASNPHRHADVRFDHAPAAIIENRLHNEKNKMEARTPLANAAAIIAQEPFRHTNS